MQDARITQAWVALRAVFGVVPIVAGIDKFANVLTHWEQYLSPLMKAMLPVSDIAFMRAVGIIEIVVGAMILTKWTRLGAYVASTWLMLIALNLLMGGQYFDIAARDVALAIGAFALARIDEACVEADTTQSRRTASAYGSPART